MDARHALLSAGFAAIEASQANIWLRPLTIGSGVILTFHRVTEPSACAFTPNNFLEVTPKFLQDTITKLRQEGFDIIPIDQAMKRLDVGTRGRPFAVITFDDGYRDTLGIARDVLRRCEAPWTVFVVPNFMDGRGRLWWLELERAIATLDQCEVPIEAGTTRRLRTCSIRGKMVAYKKAVDSLRAMSSSARAAFVSKLSDDAGLNVTALTRETCASWSDIAELSRDPDVTIGSHSESHCVLSRCTDDELFTELADSKATIENKLGRKIRYLAFPHGDSVAVGPREFRMAEQTGYEAAFTTYPSHLFPRHAQERYALPRISINGLYQTQHALSSMLSGVAFAAWSRRNAYVARDSRFHNP